MRVTKTKALISFAVTAKLLCAFVFAFADCWFSHVVAHYINVVTVNFVMNLCHGLSLSELKAKSVSFIFFFFFVNKH